MLLDECMREKTARQVVEDKKCLDRQDAAQTLFRKAYLNLCSRQSKTACECLFWRLSDSGCPLECSSRAS
jgi:hypothetical protein